jgi:aminoglycoside phosphotransferase (APT) family kinase protein
LDLSAATRAIGGQFPELAPVHASWLGEGYDSIALDVAPHWVFRFPKRADLEQQLLLELRVLPLLAPHLPLRIPEYRFHGERSPDFPRRFAGYRRIDGQPSIAVDPMHVTGTFVPSLGAFLSRLHSFPTASAIRVGVPRVDMTSFMAETQAEAIRDMDVVRTVASKESADAWCDGIATAPETVSDRSRQVLVCCLKAFIPLKVSITASSALMPAWGEAAA